MQRYQRELKLQSSWLNGANKSMMNLLIHTQRERERERVPKSISMQLHCRNCLIPFILQKFCYWTVSCPQDFPVLLKTMDWNNYIVINWGFRNNFRSCILFTTFSIAQGVPWHRNQNLICDRINISTLVHNLVNESGESIYRSTKS